MFALSGRTGLNGRPVTAMPPQSHARLRRPLDVLAQRRRQRRCRVPGQRLDEPLGPFAVEQVHEARGGAFAPAARRDPIIPIR